MKYNEEELHVIPIYELKPGKYQPRQHFDEMNLQELADSIKTQGLIQPIIVRPLADGVFEIIAGERRWRAAKLAGIESVPCLVRDVSDKQAAVLATLENIQRENLNPIEEANSYQRLIEEFNYSHEEVAVVLGIKRVHVTHSVRLLTLTNKAQQALMDKTLTAGHGKVLASLIREEQIYFTGLCVKQNWSVRKLEQAIKQQQKNNNSLNKANDPNVLQLEQAIAEYLQCPVKIEDDSDKQGGWVKLRYFNHDTLEGILEKMGMTKEALIDEY